MFDEILAMVKEHMGNNPEVAAAIPGEHTDAVHNEIASHINDTLQSQAAKPAADSGILSTIENSLSSGGLATSAITGGLVGTLASKFGLPAAVTGAIAAAIPGLLQKFTNKPNAANA
ncbi:MAG TPA: hypothetical protein VNS58_03220 [Puia sp.]|nr:hypothetical protein [Puia sp.]